ncbi:rRNA-processing protein bfr2 [Dimargaris cristalligena]|nr:rRNA-processing protein bfr2 [Dimargaris cristalligena]
MSKSLKKQLANFLDPTPEDFDPEDFERLDKPDSDATDIGSASDEDTGVDAKRDHYVKVGKLRKDENVTLSDPKYVGQRVSRKSLYQLNQSDSELESGSEVESELDIEVGGNDTSDSNDNDDTQSDAGSEGFQDSSDEVMAMGASPDAEVNWSDSEEGASADQATDDSDLEESMGSEEESSDEGESGDELESSSAMGDAEEAQPTATRTKLQKQLAEIEEQEKAMLQQLAQGSLGEMTKGRAVMRQIKRWNGFLDSRIRLQKALVMANCLPTPDRLAEAETESLHQNPLWNELKQKTGSVLRDLVDLRIRLWERNQDAGVSTDQLSHLKRPRSSSDSASSDNENENDTDSPPTKLARSADGPMDWAALDQLHQRFVPYRNDVLDKWSAKVQAASGIALNKKLRAFNQSAVHQAQETLQDRDRLLRRTQLKRTDYPPLLPDASPSITTTTTTTSTTSVGDDGKDYHPEIFDDHDFYQTLLRELIESRMATTDDPVALGKRWVALKQQQATQERERRSRTVDNKASKGRRLRYHVHEKLQNFMAPMGTSGWHADMVDELYATLLGQKIAAIQEEQPAQADSDVDLAQAEMDRLEQGQASNSNQRSDDDDNEEEDSPETEEAITSTDGLKIFG